MSWSLAGDFTSVLAALLGLILLPVLYHVYYAVAFILRTIRNGKAIDQLPGLPKHWLYGNLHQIPNPESPDTMKYLMEQTVRWPRVYRTWIGPLIPFPTFNHPDTMKILFRSSQPKYTDYSAMYTLLLPWLGESLLITSGDNWFRKRHLLTPAFHFDILKGYMDVFNESADVLITKLGHACDQGSVEICEPVRLCTLDSILRCAFSYDVDVQRQGQKNEYVIAVLQMSKLLVARAYNPILRASDFLYLLTSKGRQMRKHCNYVHQVAERIISERRVTLAGKKADESVGKRYLDFLDILLRAEDEDGIGLSDIEIRNEVDTFLFEGHDTTASGVFWIMYDLAMNPKIQDLARKEVEDVLEARNDVKWDDLGKLVYLTQCIKESLRIHPPVPITVRQLNKPLLVPGTGVTLLPGTQVEINIFGLHHNPDVWGSNHEEFIPERFTSDKMKAMDCYAYCPFSAGPRNCIGQNFAMNEMKVVISRVLRRFRMSVDESHDTGPVPELVLKANNGIKLHLEII